MFVALLYVKFEKSPSIPYLEKNVFTVKGHKNGVSGYGINGDFSDYTYDGAPNISTNF